MGTTVAGPVPSFARFQKPPRFYLWLPETDRRIVCPHDHWFTPDLTIRFGSGTAVCRQCGRAERVELLVLIAPLFTHKFIAEVSRADMAYMHVQRMTADAQLEYLQTTQVRP